MKIEVEYPAYVMLSSDYSAQEPRITAYVSQDKKMIESFQQGKDIYASIASLTFGYPYEKCLEFNPITGEEQKDGKARRGQAKVIVLGINYGMSVASLADQLYGKDDTMSEEDKVKRAQKIYDAVLNAFPNLKSFMSASQKSARQKGYVTTILGRRRHIPEMQLPEFEFKALKGYVNPDFDPLDPSSGSETALSETTVEELMKEFKGYKYFGQIARRTRELYAQHIKVINNRPKITEATRQVINSIVQGSAADQTKLAILLLENSDEWKAIGGRLLVPVHDELLAEVPIDKWREGGEILSKKMIEAASFLPFESKCDVTTTLRWYGLEYPCPYDKPENMDSDNWTEDEIRWVQYHLFEREYDLPIYPDSDGSKPQGNAAVGVNGIWSDELNNCIDDYIQTRKIDRDRFIPYIEYEVQYGRRL